MMKHQAEHFGLLNSKLDLIIHQLSSKIRTDQNQNVVNNEISVVEIDSSILNTMKTLKGRTIAEAIEISIFEPINLKNRHEKMFTTLRRCINSCILLISHRNKILKENYDRLLNNPDIGNPDFHQNVSKLAKEIQSYIISELNGSRKRKLSEFICSNTNRLSKYIKNSKLT